MDVREFQRALAELKAAYRAAGENPQSYQLKDYFEIVEKLRRQMR